MTYQFGKAVAGGTPLDEVELTQAEVQRLEALYARLRKPQQTDDLLDRRLAEELDYAQRLLEMIEHDLKFRGAAPQVIRQLADVRGVIGGVAGVVGAQDRCEGVALASAELKRRLLREAGEGDAPLCARDRGLRRAVAP